MTNYNTTNILAEPEFKLAIHLFLSKRVRFLDAVQLLQEALPERQFVQLKVAFWVGICFKYPKTYFYLDIESEHLIEELKGIGFHVVNTTYDETSYVVSLSEVPHNHICNNDEYQY